MIGDIRKFRFWCQKVLPLVYDDSLSYYEVLCKVVQYLNGLIDDVNKIPEYIDSVINERLDDEHIKELILEVNKMLEDAISKSNEGNNTHSSKDYTIGDWLWVNGTLYKAIRAIDAGDTFIVDTNIEAIAIEEYIEALLTSIANEATARESADTTLQDNIDSEANARESADTTLQDNIDAEATARASADGNLDNLSTTNKNNLVSAINEINNKATNALIFHSPTEYGAIGDGVTDDTQAVQDCIDANNNVVFDKTFKITEPITLHSNLLIIGIGGIVNETDMTTSLFGSDVHDIDIRDISFTNGDRSNHFDTETANIFITDAYNIKISNIKDDSHNKGASITLDHTNNFEINDCIITKSGYCGILLLGNCHFGNIHDNIVEVDNYTGYNNTYGIATSFTPYPRSLYPDITDRSNECTDIIIDSNNVYTSLGWWEGIDSHAGQRISITNNTVKGFMCGIVLTTGNYTTFDVSPKQCVVSNNNIIGGEIDTNRDRLVGIILAGNSESVATRLGNVIKGNRISQMLYIRNDVRKGYGILISGDGMDIIGNMFSNNVENCIVIDGAGHLTIKDNVTMFTLGKFIYFNGVSNKTVIENNLHQQGKDFYYIDSTSGLSYVDRHNNHINNATWKDGTDGVTDVTNFVPDYVAVDPSASNYKPLLGEAKNYAPTSGNPIGWICNGTNWLAEANLT